MGAMGGGTLVSITGLGAGGGGDFLDTGTGDDLLSLDTDLSREGDRVLDRVDLGVLGDLGGVDVGV